MHTPRVRRLIPILLCLPLAGCATALDVLRDVTERVTVEDVMRCAELPAPSSRARCMGAEAASTALDIAIANAARLGALAIRAISPGGAQDFTAAECRQIAAELDDALAEVTRLRRESH